MNKKILFVLLASILSSFVAPISAFEELGEVSLKPMEKPSPLPMVAGAERHWLKEFCIRCDLDQSRKNSKEHIIYYESVDSDKYRMRDVSGGVKLYQNRRFRNAGIKKG